MDNRFKSIPPHRLIILAIAAFLSPVMLQLTGNGIFKILDDLIFIFLLIDSWIALHKKKVAININKTCSLVIFIVCAYLITESLLALIYGNEVLVVILQFRQYKYMFLVLILHYYNSEKDYETIHKLASIIAYCSIPISIVQRILVPSNSGDYVTGLYGANTSGIMTMFLLILFFSEFTRNLSLGNRLVGWEFLYFIPIAINETKIAFYLIPFFFLIAIIISKKNILKSLITISVILFLIFLPFSMMFQKLYSENIWDYYSNKETLNNYMMMDVDADMGRVLKIQMGYDIISEKPLSTLVGYGLGAGYVGAGDVRYGHIAVQYTGQTNLFGATRTQVFDLLIDTGLFGLFFLYVMLFTLFTTIISAQRRAAFKQRYYYVAIFSLLTWTIGLFYNEVMIMNNLFFFMTLSIYMTCINLTRLQNA